MRNHSAPAVAIEDRLDEFHYARREETMARAINNILGAGIRLDCNYENNDPLFARD
jgi:hypothetical protein